MLYTFAIYLRTAYVVLTCKTLIYVFVFIPDNSHSNRVELQPSFRMLILITATWLHIIVMLCSKIYTLYKYGPCSDYNVQHGWDR